MLQRPRRRGKPGGHSPRIDQRAAFFTGLHRLLPVRQRLPDPRVDADAHGVWTIRSAAAENELREELLRL